MGIIDANPRTSSSFSPEAHRLHDLMYIDEATSKLIPIKTAKELGDLLDSRVGNRIQYCGAGRMLQSAPVEQVVHYATQGEYLRYLYEHDRLMDVRIFVDRSAFLAHRVALSCFSGYFAAFFDKAKVNRGPIEIEMAGISGKAFAAFLEYVYTGEVSADLNLTADLLILSENLKVESLKQKIRPVLDDMNLSEVVELLLKSKPKMTKVLYSHLLAKVLSQFVAASRVAGFLDLDVDTFCSVLASDDLEVSREYDVFLVALRWIVHGARERLKHAVRVMSLIRFCFMSSEELFNCVAETEMFRSSSKLMDMVLIANWIVTCITLQRDEPFGFPVSKPRRSYSANVRMRNVSASPADKYKVGQGPGFRTRDSKYVRTAPMSDTKFQGKNVLGTKDCSFQDSSNCAQSSGPTRRSPVTYTITCNVPKPVHSPKCAKPVLLPADEAAEYGPLPSPKPSPQQSQRYAKPVLLPQLEAYVRNSEDRCEEPKPVISPKCAKPVLVETKKSPLPSPKPSPQLSPRHAKPVLLSPLEAFVKNAEELKQMHSPRWVKPVLEPANELAEYGLLSTLKPSPQQSSNYSKPVLLPPDEASVRNAEESQEPISCHAKRVLLSPLESSVKNSEEPKPKPMHSPRWVKPVLVPANESAEYGPLPTPKPSPQQSPRYSKPVLLPPLEAFVRNAEESQEPMSSPRLTKPLMIPPVSHTENETRPVMSPQNKPTHPPLFANPYFLPPTEVTCYNISDQMTGRKPVSSPRFGKPVLSPPIATASLQRSENHHSSGESSLACFKLESIYLPKHMTEASRIPSPKEKLASPPKYAKPALSNQTKTLNDARFDKAPSPKPVSSPRYAKPVLSPRTENASLRNSEISSTSGRSSLMCDRYVPMLSPMHGKPVLIKPFKKKKKPVPLPKQKVQSPTYAKQVLFSPTTTSSDVPSSPTTVSPMPSPPIYHDQQENASTDRDEDQQVSKPLSVKRNLMPFFMSPEISDVDLNLTTTETESVRSRTPDLQPECRIPQTHTPSSGRAKKRPVPSEENAEIGLTGSSKKARTKTFEIYVVGEFRSNIYDGVDDNSDLVRYCSLPAPRRFFAVVMVTDKLYLLGGCNPVLSRAKALNTVFLLDPLYKKWTVMAPMQDARMHHCACAHDDNIYVFGGLDRKNRASSTVECYYTATNSWMYLPVMPTPRYAAAAVSFGNECYVVGGLAEVADVSTMEILDSTISFNPKTKEWKPRGNLRVPLCYTSLVNVSGRLMICAGSTCCDHVISVHGGAPALNPCLCSVHDIDEYDPEEDSWCHVTKLTIPRHNAGVTVVGNRIYVFGGVNSTSGHFLRSTECYDTGIRAWLENPGDLPYPACWIQCVSCQKKMLINLCNK